LVSQVEYDILPLRVKGFSRFTHLNPATVLTPATGYKFDPGYGYRRLFARAGVATGSPEGNSREPLGHVQHVGRYVRIVRQGRDLRRGGHPLVSLNLSGPSTG
jgi:hypothetical protein